MTLEDFFGDWIRVVDKKETIKILKWLSTIDRDTICPEFKNIFKAFKLCSYHNCKAIFLGQDVYPQKGVATGILFGNKDNSNISPSLEIIKDAVIDYSIPHNIINFDYSLENWAKQGILMINSALTCEVNKISSHVYIWRPFISKLIENMCKRDYNLIFVLFGKQAQSFKPFIKGQQIILEIEHPAYFFRLNKPMPSNIFYSVNYHMNKLYNETFKFYQECYM